MEAGDDSHQLLLASHNLETWPADVPASTTSLNLNHNKLTEVSNDINKLQCLQSFSAIGNDIESLSTEIGCVKNLKELNLTENCLSSLPDSFCHLTQLTKMVLLGNVLKDLPADIGLMSNLQQLDLSENMLSLLPDSFGSLKNLELFDASHNQIISIPDSFGGLSSLKHLNVSHNSLCHLPSTFFELRNLEILDLSTNQIAVLPSKCEFMSSLLEIDLNDNCLHSLPPWLGQLHSVRKICLGENKLIEKALPESLGTGCPALEYLDLSGNRITHLPENLTDLSNLRFLDVGSVLPELERKIELLNGNIIARLPFGFGALCNLVELRLDENHIDELPEDFGDLSSLEIVDFGQDALRSLPASFCHLSKLHTCSLAMNCLTHLPEHFGNLTSLVSLRLDQNCLTSLPDSFSQLSNLQYLDLFYNKMEAFPSCLYSLFNLKSLNIQRNKFKQKDAPRIVQKNTYAARDPALADNWRGRVTAPIAWTQTDVVVVQGEYESSEEDDDDVAPGYRLVKRATRAGLTTWQSHTSALADTDRQIYRERSVSPLSTADCTEDLSSECTTESTQDWNAPCPVEEDWSSTSCPQEDQIMCGQAEENWDACDMVNNPYGTPLMYQHPIICSNKGFVPAALHRPSHLYLFGSRPPAPEEDGQFEDA